MYAVLVRLGDERVLVGPFDNKEDILEWVDFHHMQEEDWTAHPLANALQSPFAVAGVPQGVTAQARFTPTTPAGGAHP